MSSFAGIDWASRTHALCVVDGGGSVLTSATCSHTEAGIRKLLAQMRQQGVCRVALERPDGVLVDRLLDAGFAVFAIPPAALKATRPRYETSNAKSDAFDAFCLAELARTDSHRYRTLRSDSDDTRALRMMTRRREDLVGIRVQMANQLRAHLEGFWPGAARVFADVDSKLALSFLRRYPSPSDARKLDEGQLAAFLKEHRYRNTRSPAELLGRLRSAPAASTGPAEAAACRVALLGLVSTLEPVIAQIIESSRQISRATRAHPDGKIFLPLFRHPAATITAALLIVEIGDDRARYSTAEVLAAKAGVAPVARESGTRKEAMFRYACNRRLRGAVATLANSSRTHNPWARGVYAAARERGLRHPHALRVLGRAWVRVLWRCWQDEVAYDPSKHGNLRRLQSG
jgi:transposase